ncbi:flagellar hook-associated protein flgk [hydrocarbon metagenome]|uniref:Flagellar hook-associated protein flgk n=1 Tax=hydrocarbon metagenome TaxID=938273 RepID=A0A0W8G6U4_9ZZZZ
MPGISSILNIAQSGLRASQLAIEVTGNNIANVDTEGYSRQVLLLEEAMSINYSPGQLGTGVLAKQVVRLFDKFIELQYLDKSSTASSYEAAYSALQSVEALFNEANTKGISSALSQFLADLQELTLNPENSAVRQVLVSDAENLLSMISQVDSDLASIQNQMDSYISQDVDRINDLAKEIAEINTQINQYTVEGSNNPNALYDLRDVKIRELASIVDLQYVDNGYGNITIMTKAGHTIVDGTTTFKFAFEQGRTTKQLTQGSTFDGQAYYDGSDEYEYTLQVVNAGSVTSGAGAATFRVSLDGGKTWLKDDNGDDILYSARPEDGKVRVGELDIWFGSASNPDDPSSGALSAGDTFTLVPKKAVYWYKSAGTVVNVTPQAYSNGTANTSRITGGSLNGYFTVRDVNVSAYRERLAAFTESLVWEVNRLHSQGAGLSSFSYASGSYTVANADTALGSPSSGLVFGDKLSSGVSSMYFYDAATGKLASASSFGFIDFDPVASGAQPFDPAVHSLNDVVDAINNTFGTFCTAQVINGSLSVTANPGYTFAFGDDSSGLYAALGINTFFTGSTPFDAAVNTVVANNLNFINAGHVNGAGEMNAGDNTTALALAELSTKKVTMSTFAGGDTSQTLSGYYNSLVGLVGVDTQNAKYNYLYQSALADELAARQDAVSAVSLDEEMANLIRFQQSYQAAAKLISTADQMFQTILGMKS